MPKEFYFTLKGYSNGENQLKFDLDFTNPFSNAHDSQKIHHYINHDNVEDLQKFFVLISQIYLFLDDPDNYPDKVKKKQEDKTAHLYGPSKDSHHPNTDAEFLESLKKIAASYKSSKNVRHIHFEQYNPVSLTVSMDSTVTNTNGDMRPPRIN